MTDLAVHREPAIVTQDGEILELALSTPISVDEAATLLPRVRSTLDAVRRYVGFLEELVKDSMISRGQRERRAGDTVYELRSETAWVVDDPGALFHLLHQAAAKSEITENELAEACQQLVTFKFHHGRLSSLARRLPEIEKLRRRVDGEPRLRTKS